ncbi:MAG: efflux RND transporter permease subunit, partial [Oceanococcus sp.]
ALPRSSAGLSTGSKAFDPRLGLNNDGCRAIQVLIFTENHEGPTIAHIIDEIKDFIEENPVDGVTMRLASGNVGVMAATNEEVKRAEVKMLLSLFAALVVFCLISFRSWTALICVLVPLVAVTVMGNALMAMLDIGLKVATLPVIALGVGVGVDYGIYLFERIQHYMHDPKMSFQKAFALSMRDRGSAIVFTAATMSVGVLTWMMSDLKYQADMGLLLAFLFLVNMFGAICLLPALGSWFFRKRDAALAAASQN